MIYADNAAATKSDEDAFEAMKPFLLSEYGNASQHYSFSRTSKKVLRDVRSQISECIGAPEEEIYFTSGGMESNNWVIKGTLRPKDKRRLITSAFERHSILNAYAHIERFGRFVTYIYPNRDGIVTPEKLYDSIGEQPKLVSIMTVNNEIGTIQPIKELCARTHDCGALFHTDAVHAVEHLPLDVHELNVDFLSASAHKFNGPKGIGFLYIRKGVEIEPFSDGGGQEAGLRAGTENAAAIVGMAAALKKSCGRILKTEKQLSELEQIILDMLKKAGIDFRQNGSASHIPGNLSLSFRGLEGEMLLHRLDLMGIMVSTGSACDSKNIRISHVLKAIGADENYAPGTVRISLRRDNTPTEAEKIAEALIKIISRR